MGKKDILPEASQMPDAEEQQKSSGPLQGWPGYRNRPGRTGYDPIDSDTEAAHTSGTLLQKLFTGRLKIRNPLALFLVGGAGLLLIIPLLLAISEGLNGNTYVWNGWIYIVLAAVVGLALLFNFIKNLLTRNR